MKTKILVHFHICISAPLMEKTNYVRGRTRADRVIFFWISAIVKRKVAWNICRKKYKTKNSSHKAKHSYFIHSVFTELLSFTFQNPILYFPVTVGKYIMNNVSNQKRLNPEGLTNLFHSIHTFVLLISTANQLTGYYMVVLVFLLLTIFCFQGA